MPKTALVTGGDEGLLTIGALSRATGVPVETLRTWERRYRNPMALRKPSGHRLYPLSAVPRLRRAVEAIERGHRPAEVLTAADAAIERLLSEFGAATILEARTAAAAPAISSTADAARPARRGASAALAALRTFDAGALRAWLEREWTSREPLDFLERAAGPLLVAIGREWHKGRIGIRHEHFASAQIADFLRERRRPHEARARGPWVALATLPGDHHEGGILMASVVFSLSGWRIVYLGTDTPIEQIAALASETRIAAVAIGVSPTANGAPAELRTLRQRLPRTVALLVGGEGAKAVPRGATRLGNLTRLNEWIGRFTDG
jgi:methanogenic corrinoid protein MtbC1